MSHDPLTPFDERSFSNKPNETTTTRLDDVKQRVSQIAANTKDRAGQVAETVSETLNDQRENAAEGLGRVASTLHEKAERVPGGPKAVNLTHRVADGMESTASYLRDHDFSKMGDDLMAVCRKYPTQSLVTALTLGFLLGRSARR